MQEVYNELNMQSVMLHIMKGCKHDCWVRLVDVVALTPLLIRILSPEFYPRQLRPHCHHVVWVPHCIMIMIIMYHLQLICFNSSVLYCVYCICVCRLVLSFVYWSRVVRRLRSTKPHYYVDGMLKYQLLHR